MNVVGSSLSTTRAWQPLRYAPFNASRFLFTIYPDKPCNGPPLPQNHIATCPIFFGPRPNSDHVTGEPREPQQTGARRLGLGLGRAGALVCIDLCNVALLPVRRFAPLPTYGAGCLLSVVADKVEASRERDLETLCDWVSPLKMRPD